MARSWKKEIFRFIFLTPLATSSKSL